MYSSQVGFSQHLANLSRLTNIALKLGYSTEKGAKSSRERENIPHLSREYCIFAVYSCKKFLLFSLQRFHSQSLKFFLRFKLDLKIESKQFFANNIYLFWYSQWVKSPKKRVCRSVFLTTWHCNLSAELKIIIIIILIIIFYLQEA